MKNFALPLAQMLNPGTSLTAIIEFLRVNGIDLDTKSEKLSKSLAQLCYYDQRPIIASGVNRFFGNQSGTVQNTNMKNSNYTLPDMEHFVILGIRVLFGNNATLNNIDWAYGADNAVTKNALLKLQIGNIIQYNLLPLTLATPDLTTDDNGFIWCNSPILWPAQTAVTLELTTQGAAIVANDSIRLELHGFGFTS